MKKINLFNLAICIFLASLSGYYIGNVYIANLSNQVIELNITEDQIRGNVAGLISSSINKNPSNFTATENFMLAEYNLINSDFYTKTIDGKIIAMGVSQSLKGLKVKVDDEYFSEKISRSSFASIAQRSYYQNGSDDVNLYEGQTSDGNTASWNKSPNTLSVDDYKNQFGGKPTSPLSYIVSNRVLENNNTTTLYNGDIKKIHNGNYQFEINLDTSYSVINYQKEVRAVSGFDELPKFKSIKLVVEMTSDWQFVEIEYFEEYTIKIPVIGYQNCSANYTDSFDFTNRYQIPTM